MNTVISLIKTWLRLLRDQHNQLTGHVWGFFYDMEDDPQFAHQIYKEHSECAFQQDLQLMEMEDDETLVKRANDILERILWGAQQLGYNISYLHWEIAIPKKYDCDGVAYYSGKILVNRPWVKYAPEAVLAGIIAHEVAHIINQDGRLQWVLGCAVNATVAGYEEEKQQLISEHLHLNLMLPFLRRCEVLADRVGTELLVESGYPRHGLLLYLYICWLWRDQYFTLVPTTHPTSLWRMWLLK